MQVLSLWLPVVLYMSAIFYASSLTSLPTPEEVSDKTLHFVVYGGLALVVLRAVAGGRWAGVTPTALVASWVIATLYGVTDEWHQTWTEGRTPEIADVAADALGAVMGAGAAGAWSIIRRL
jgi:VanZ family protein